MAVDSRLSTTNPTAIATAGAAVPTTGTLVMGSDGTNSQPLATDSSGRLIVTSTTSPSALPAGTDRSGTATTSATTPIAANASRVGLVIQNTGTNAIWFNETGGTAAANALGSYLISAGQTASIRTNRVISIIAVTGSTTFSATEW